VCDLQTALRVVENQSATLQDMVDELEREVEQVTIFILSFVRFFCPNIL
jgi:hypothetical protein